VISLTPILKNCAAFIPTKCADLASVFIVCSGNFIIKFLAQRCRQNDGIEMNALKCG